MTNSSCGPTRKLHSWLRRLFAGESKKSRSRPPEWNKTLSDLTAENRSLSGEEIEWARQYEREQLRSWARFPKDGEEFEALRELQITYLIHWRAPYSSGGEGRLPKGTRVRVSVPAFDLEPVGVYAVPIEEKVLEKQLIPEADRLDGKYGGYSLSLKVAQLNTDFQPVQPNAAVATQHPS